LFIDNQFARPQLSPSSDDDAACMTKAHRHHHHQQQHQQELVKVDEMITRMHVDAWRRYDILLSVNECTLQFYP